MSHSTSPFRLLRNRLLLTPIAAALAVAISSGVAFAQEKTYNFDTPPVPLAQALRDFARITHAQLSFTDEQLAGKVAPALRGNFSADDALRQLLSGSGFTAARTTSGALVVQKEGANVPPADAVKEPTAEQKGLDTVLVTGSRIERTTRSIPGSVTIFDKQSIERSGESSVRDVISQTGQAGMTPTALSAFLGAAPIQLRGLSSGTTLVLVDGRRVTPSGVTGVTFDVGSIPLAAVERIEVLADGASAIYGADAVGGIINVILKRSSNGLIVEGRYGQADGGVGKERRISANYGFSSDRLRGSFTADYFDSGAIKFADRERTSDLNYTRFGSIDRRSALTNQGTVFSTDGSNLPGLSSNRAIIPVTTNGKPAVSDFFATAGQQKLGSESVAPNNLQPPAERVGIVGDLTYDLGGDTRAFTNVLLSKQQGTYIVTQAFSNAAILIPKENPFNPFGVPVTVSRLLTGVGADVNRTADEFVRLLAGLRGKLNKDLRWEFGVNYSRDNNSVHEDNAYNAALIQAAVNRTDPNTALNLFATGPVAASSVLQTLLPGIDKSYLASALGVDAQLSGSLIDLPNGRLSFAFGAEARKDKLGITSPFDNTKGSRTVASTYLELRAPVLQTLTLSGAGRYDHYSDFGNTFNPKLGFEWTPSDSVLFSGTWGTSFRAPPLAYVNSIPFTTQVTGTDPARGNAPYVVPSTSGGNHGLKAETADSKTIGIRWTPLDEDQQRLNFGLSVWWVSQDKRVVSPSYPILVEHSDLFPGRVIRAPQTAQDIAAGYPGALQSIDASYANFGKSETNGVDLQLSYRSANGPLRWSASGNATRVLKYEAELVPGLIENRLGAFSFDGYAPKWRGSASGTVGVGPMDFTTTVRYIGAYQDQRVKPYYTLNATTFVDMQLAYEDKNASGLMKGLRLTMGASNVTNKAPPFFSLSTSYDPYNYNYRGRFIYLNLQKRF